ncbi:SatD family protein [Bacillus cereus]|uniref:SatD family protein n=1 Tax=Bacillus cereus TaxID=1396 RepID=UPI000BFB1B1B|nr:SatD family protein [Bacillus cereus]PGQ97926.1 hypothetical protein COA28_01730 [Bacillus cereus]
MINLSKNRYAACIALDIIGSESSSNQRYNFNKLKKISEKLNWKFEDNLVVPFQMRLGDELIGVLDSFSNGYKVFHELWLLVDELEIKIRIGLGFGKFDTLETTDVNEINGSCVISAFRARDKFLKGMKIPYSHTELIQFYAYSNQSDIPFRSVNALVYTMYEELIKTEQQKKLIVAKLKYPDATYEEIAEKIGYSNRNIKSGISKALTRGNYDLFVQMKNDLIDLLNTIQHLLDKD